MAFAASAKQVKRGRGQSSVVCVNRHSSGAQQRARTSAPMGIGFPWGHWTEEEPGVPAGGDLRRRGSGPLCAIPSHRAGKYRDVCVIFLHFLYTPLTFL